MSPCLHLDEVQEISSTLAQMRAYTSIYDYTRKLSRDRNIHPIGAREPSLVLASRQVAQSGVYGLFGWG